MSEKNDGGPAFPKAVAVSSLGDVYSGTGGMTLRDYFAAAALTTGCTVTKSGERVTPEAFAKAAYQLADAMLAER